MKAASVSLSIVCSGCGRPVAVEQQPLHQLTPALAENIFKCQCGVRFFLHIQEVKN